MKKLFLILILLILASGCVSNELTGIRKTGKPNIEFPNKSVEEGPPTIYDIGIDLEPWDENTNYAGDVSFDGLQYSEKIFLEFGADEGDGSLNPHPMFVLPLGTEIHAVSAGIVYWIESLGDNDYDVCVNRYEGDQWCVSYEHISSPRVEEGDIVNVGDVIGEAGRINEFTEFGKFDLKVWKGGQTVLNYCPYELLDEHVRERMQAKITRFIEDWEEYMGKNIYNEEDWVSPGCAAETLQEEPSMQG
ncbi:MAG: peptidoglycan DD-metalloendopeptidase family protein [Candidatus Aenigmarchaeota archaeon]|nr:peptidoglycan DD-metalloendopeptidase family protein [Candidatus Aenigmarchaeota archaeon]